MDSQRFLEPGDEVPGFSARTLSDPNLSVDFANGSKTVLLVFQPQCPACEIAVPYWLEIAAAGKRDKYQVFGITLGDAPKTAAFLASSGLDVETFVDLNAEMKRAYKLNLTPLTVVIDNAGKVEKIWPGAFNRETKPDVERYFGISVADDMK